MSAQVTKISGGAACSSCRIVLIPQAILRDVEGHLSSALSSMARDHVGRFYAASQGGTSVLMFSPDGTMVRSIGRRGTGPGEHLSIARVFADAQGNLHTVDAQLSRHSVFSATGKFLRSVPITTDLSPTYDMVLTREGDLVRNSVFAPSAGRAYLLHAVSLAGQVVYRGDLSPSDRHSPWTLQRKLSTGAGGIVYAAHLVKYEIDVFRPNLTRSMKFTRAVDWFPAFRGAQRPSDGVLMERPVAKVSRIWEDTQGRLWVMVFVPSAKWRPMPRPTRPLRPGDEQILRPRYDIMIEVLDLPGRRMLVSQRFDGTLGVPFGDGFLAARSVQPNGEVHVSVSQLTITP